jgi:hypothetical protein
MAGKVAPFHGTRKRMKSPSPTPFGILVYAEKVDMYEDKGLGADHVDNAGPDMDMP